jgi:sugar lactone lactonase YvrE
VLDGKLRRIARFAAGGEFRGYLEPAERSVVPRSFRVGPLGELYVLDVRSGRVRVVGPDGEQRREIALPAGLRFASDLALDPRGALFVLDSVGRRVYAAGAGDAELAPLSESLAEDLDFATAIALDESGLVYLADEHGGGVVFVGRDGTFRGRQAAYGWKPGMLRYPSDLCVAGNLLYVADRANHRVQVFEISE